MGRTDAIAWIDTEDAAIVASAVRSAGLDLVAVGCPQRGQAQGLAERMGVEPMTDLRAAVASTEAGLVLMTTTGASRDAQHLDARTVSAADGRGVRLATTVPFASGYIEAAETGFFRETAGARTSEVVHLVPRPRRHEVFRSSAEVLEAFGHVRLITVEAQSPARCGALPAALMGAVDTVLALAGTPELVDAATVGSPKGVVDLAGEINFLLRFPDGRSGHVAATDGPAWGWRVTLWGEAGRLTLRPSGFDWFEPGGERRDEFRAEPGRRDYTDTLSRAIRELTDPSAPKGPATNWIDLLSTAEAALLSTRTGQPESPGTIARAMATAE